MSPASSRPSNLETQTSCSSSLRLVLGKALGWYRFCNLYTLFQYPPYEPCLSCSRDVNLLSLRRPISLGQPLLDPLPRGDWLVPIQISSNLVSSSHRDQMGKGRTWLVCRELHTTESPFAFCHSSVGRDVTAIQLGAAHLKNSIVIRSKEEGNRIALQARPVDRSMDGTLEDVVFWEVRRG